MSNDRLIPLTFLLALGMTVVILSANVVGASPETGDSQTGEETDITVYGYVSNISDQEKNVPLEWVGVTLQDSLGRVLQETVTDHEGRFVFTYPQNADATFISFSHEGYMVRTLPSDMEMVEENKVRFNLDDSMKDSQGYYALSGNGSSVNAIGMGITNGSIYGSIRGTDGDDVFFVEGATITATSVTGRSFTANSDANGYFEMTVPYGDYTVTVTRDGFSASEAITVSTSDNTPMEITLEQNQFGLFGGIDAPHALIILGLTLIGIFMAILILAIHYSDKGRDIRIDNDLSDFEEQTQEHP